MSVQPEFAQPPGPQPGGQPLYRVSLTKVSSFVIYTQQRRSIYTGTLEQLEQHARSVQTHNLLLGWWGIPAGLIWTPMALSRNAKNMNKVRALATGRQI